MCKFTSFISISGSRLYGGLGGRFDTEHLEAARGGVCPPMPGFANVEFDNKAMSHVDALDGGMQHMMFLADRLILLIVTHASANRSQCRYNHPTEVSRSAATDRKSRDFTL